MGEREALGIALAESIADSIRGRVAFAKLEEGSSKTIRKIMEELETSGARQDFKGKEMKKIALLALGLVAQKNPDSWAHTVAVAADQIDDLAKAAKGLSKINRNTSLLEIAANVQTLMSSVHQTGIGQGTGCFCLPKKKK